MLSESFCMVVELFFAGVENVVTVNVVWNRRVCISFINDLQYWCLFMIGTGFIHLDGYFAFTSSRSQTQLHVLRQVWPPELSAAALSDTVLVVALKVVCLVGGWQQRGVSPALAARERISC